MLIKMLINITLVGSGCSIVDNIFWLDFKKKFFEHPVRSRDLRERVEEGAVTTWRGD